MKAAPHPAAIDSSRRRLLGSFAVSAVSPWASLSFSATGNATGNRFVFVILRGGLDGLTAVPAVGDPDFAAARGPLARFAAAPLPLDAPFALHPELAQLHAAYGAGELAVVHAVGLPYRERSHFDAQQVLESGSDKPYELTTGWLGRALARSTGKTIALSTAVPLVLRGSPTVDTWTPATLPDPSLELVARLERLYAQDAALGQALARAKALHVESAGSAATGRTADAADRRGFVVLARRAADFLGEPNGPQAAVLEINGWDTHANQANPNGALAFNLRQLDAGLAELRSALIANGAWPRTVVVVATEFGREVQVNGTLGTDHGSGAAAFVVGGAVRGGRVVADWPGLSERARFEGRDLRTTTDLRAVFKGILDDHLQIATRALDEEVFPQSRDVRPIALLKA